PDVSTDVKVIFDDDPAHTIVAFASEQPIDLIVMATHGRTGVGRWLMGSVTSKVLRASSVPVVVVPAPKRRAFDRPALSEEENR
ncbi:MAG: universal stress protein, partial [Gemmatimonadota bacterium]